ncbi:MAG: YbaN family protein [Sarcina sp.]
MNKILKIFLITVGFISFILGFIGIAIPVLPTTPFFILSYICFFKSSKKFHNWFIKSKLYQKYVADFINQKGITLKRKIYIVATADVFIFISMLIVRNLYMSIGLTLVIIFKYWYFFFKIKTIEEIKPKQLIDKINE